MKTINKSENPNIWWLLNLTSRFNYSRPESINTLCELWLKLLIGVAISFGIVVLGVVAPILILEAPLRGLTKGGFYCSEITSAVSVVLWVCFIILGAIIGSKYCILKTIDYILNHTTNGVGRKVVRKIKESPLIEIYDSWKNKYCIQVKLVDDTKINKDEK